MRKTIKYFSIKDLLGTDEEYVIPVYQRNYAWGEKEITQLIQDIADYVCVNKDQNYYIGTLVAFERNNNGNTVYEIIDGQQRFTTLTILLCLLKNDYYGSIDTSWFKQLNLRFSSRKNSSDTLQKIFTGNVRHDEHDNIDIIAGYDIAKKTLKKILQDSKLEIDDFCKYLFKEVQILRVLVPDDTDLNHYFEIMNTRGVQLEKHEILKAKLMEVLDDKEKVIFHKIWEACSNMEKYVQHGFSPEERDNVFGSNWDTLVGKEELYSLPLDQIEKENSECQSITELISLPPMKNNTKDDKKDDDDLRFNTIINFSNFLLHVLRIQLSEDIPLDDKRLLEIFYSQKQGKKDFDRDFVRLFGYNLIKIKFLYDKYVIKREIKIDKWSLKKMVLRDRKSSSTYFKNSFDINNEDDIEAEDGINRELIMLLSMFHVSTPTLVYKHWLNGTLKWLFEQKEPIEPEKYKDYLERMAKSFVTDRFLAKSQLEYFDIIYTNSCISMINDLDWTKLDKGVDVENFLFNYLDYLLWKNYQGDKRYFEVDGKTVNDPNILKFEYSFRSSVEHYYPQHPIDDKLNIRNSEWLDNFGNLCLLSGSKNSRLSNYMPKAKKDHYEHAQTIDSIKQRIMMGYENWDIGGTNGINEIEMHGNMMKELLKSTIEEQL